MPIVKRIQGKRRSPIADDGDAATVNGEVVLPTEYSTPSTSLSDYSMLLYGSPKAGKTSLCSQMPGATFLFFEPGGRAMSLRAVDVPDWKSAKSLLKQLQADTKKIHETVIVDVVDRAYDQCFKYVCQKNGITHPNDENDYGKSWNEVKKEWSGWVSGILALSRGVVFISHDRFVSVQRRDGSKVDILAPTLTGQALGVLEGLVDTVAYYGYNGSQRTLVIRGHELIVAGTRIDNNFLTRKGERIQAINMGSSKEQAYANTLKAFNNRLDDVGELPLIVPPVRKSKKEK